MELINWFLGCTNDILIYCSKHTWAAFLCMVVLISGPYLIYAAFKMRGFNKELEEKNKLYRRTEAYNALLAEVEVDRLVWNEIEQRVSKYELSKPGKVDELYKELHDDLIEIFGTDYREKFPLPGVHVNENFYAPSNNNMWAAHLLIAHMGKVRPSPDICGWSIGGVNDVEMNIAMIHRIEYYIKKFHPERGNAYDICIEGRRLEHGEQPPFGYALSDHKHACGQYAKLRCAIEMFHHVAVKLE